MLNHQLHIDLIYAGLPLYLALVGTSIFLLHMACDVYCSAYEVLFILTHIDRLMDLAVDAQMHLANCVYSHLMANGAISYDVFFQGYENQEAIIQSLNNSNEAIGYYNYIMDRLEEVRRLEDRMLHYDPNYQREASDTFSLRECYEEFVAYEAKVNGADNQ